jgi:hypothetical protein
MSGRDRRFYGQQLRKAEQAYVPSINIAAYLARKSIFEAFCSFLHSNDIDRCGNGTAACF